MSRNLHGFPGAQVVVDVLHGLGQFATQLADLLFHAGPVILRPLELLQAGFQFVDRLFEGQAGCGYFHGPVRCVSDAHQLLVR